MFRFKNIYIPAFVLAFIFCGAIVGETISISLVVSAFGSKILSQLYLVNGLLLYGLPLFLLSKIDRVDRGNLLSRQLLVISGILVFILLIITFVSHYQIPFKNAIIFLLYPISYLSKTILFLTFWTLANDLYTTSEAKKTFPIIAAWGMAGGLTGACTARILITVLPSESIIVLWAASFLAAWYFSGKTRQYFGDRLRFREDLPTQNSHLFSDASDVLTIKIVRLMAVLYFLIFIAIFSIDYLFWNECHRWFDTSRSLVSFQFTFYLVHACVTILGLWLVVPPLIRKYGFTKLFYCLPIALLVGASILLPLHVSGPAKTFFAFFMAIQFLRYIVFENTFSPIYQMFFAAIEKEKRGRAKTLLEGIVKPAAIICSGLLLMALRHNSTLIFALVIVSCVTTVIIIFYLRRTYSISLIPETITQTEPKQIIANVTQYEGKKLQSIIQEYSESKDPDMRIVSIKLLAGIATFQAFEMIVQMYDKEKVLRVKEFIAMSIAGFYWYQVRPFVERLLDDPNPRIRANILFAINKMNCNWKRHLKSKVHHFLFDTNLRVQIEAAKYLWKNGEASEQETTLVFFQNLIASQSPERKSAALYLAGSIQTRGWQQILIENLTATSPQVFKKCIEVILRSSSKSLRITALKKVESLPREQIAITGKLIRRVGSSLWDTLIEYLPECKNRRMIFEIVRCLRIAADEIRSAGKMWVLGDTVSSTLQLWVLNELELVYRDSFVRMQLENSYEGVFFEILDQSLRENHLRLCEWALNAMVLLDKTGVLVWRHTDLDIRENNHRMDLVEILESAPYQKVGMLVLPLLKNDSWGGIARVGKGNFHFEEQLEKEYIEYFLKSDNRWVVLCGLRTMLYYSEELFKKVSIVEILQMLTRDSNKHVSSAARDLLKSKNHEERLRSDAFILLEKVLFFKRTSLFQNVSAEKLMRLAEISQYAVYEKDTVISVQGEVSDHLYIIKKGSLKVIKSDAAIATVISMIEVGETYGEIGLFTQSPRSASAIANESCELYIIKRAAFKKLLLEIPEIAYNMLETMSERLKKNADEMVVLQKRSDEDFMIENSM
jgi:hypothetical protein